MRGQKTFQKNATRRERHMVAIKHFEQHSRRADAMPSKVRTVTLFVCSHFSLCLSLTLTVITVLSASPYSVVDCCFVVTHPRSSSLVVISSSHSLSCMHVPTHITPVTKLSLTLSPLSLSLSPSLSLSLSVAHSAFSSMAHHLPPSSRHPSPSTYLTLPHHK
jgi:hypothetical protein